MQIHISTSDSAPIYLQIMRQIRYLAASGRLAPGEELPAIRTLAEQLVINPNTVARAYRELEHEGIVEKRRTAGTYISLSSPLLRRQQSLEPLMTAMDGLLAQAKKCNVELEELIALLRERESIAQQPS